MSDADIVPFKGRPPKNVKFTPKRQKEIVEFCREGLVPSNAGPLAGVAGGTVNNWLKLGDEDPDGPYGEFALKVRQAQAEFKRDLLAQIKRIGIEKDQWAALMTILERVYPEEFKRPAEGAKVTVNVGILEARVHELQKKGELVYDGG